MQNANLNSTREECACLNAKLEVLEQRQGAAKHQISDNAQTQSVHAKQVDKCLEEHQHRLMMTINKAESRGREAAEQIAQQAVSDAQTSMQVLHCAATSCLHHALQEPIPHRLELTLQRLPQAAYDSHMSCRGPQTMFVRRFCCLCFVPRECYVCCARLHILSWPAD